MKLIELIKRVRRHTVVSGDRRTDRHIIEDLNDAYTFLLETARQHSGGIGDEMQRFNFDGNTTIKLDYFGAGIRKVEKEDGSDWVCLKKNKDCQNSECGKDTATTWQVFGDKIKITSIEKGRIKITYDSGDFSVLENADDIPSLLPNKFHKNIWLYVVRFNPEYYKPERYATLKTQYETEIELFINYYRRNQFVPNRKMRGIKNEW